MKFYLPYKIIKIHPFSNLHVYLALHVYSILTHFPPYTFIRPCTYIRQVRVGHQPSDLQKTLKSGKRLLLLSKVSIFTVWSFKMYPVLYRLITFLSLKISSWHLCDFIVMDKGLKSTPFFKSNFDFFSTDAWPLHSANCVPSINTCPNAINIYGFCSPEHFWREKVND